MRINRIVFKSILAIIVAIVIIGLLAQNLFTEQYTFLHSDAAAVGAVLLACAGLVAYWVMELV